MLLVITALYYSRADYDPFIVIELRNYDKVLFSNVINSYVPTQNLTSAWVVVYPPPDKIIVCSPGTIFRREPVYEFYTLRRRVLSFQK